MSDLGARLDRQPVDSADRRLDILISF